MSNNQFENPLDIINVFSEQATSSELDAGVHENVRLVSIDTEVRRDRNKKVINKQLYLKFKKINDAGDDLGEKEISFFIIDPTQDAATNNLRSFIVQVRDILSIYLTEKELNEKFDPIRKALFDEAKEEEIDYDSLLFANMSTTVKKSAQYKKIEKEIAGQFKSLIGDNNIGFESKAFRLKLEESKDQKYIQLPRYGMFIESMEIPKEESKLYNN